MNEFSKFLLLALNVFYYFKLFKFKKYYGPAYNRNYYLILKNLGFCAYILKFGKFGKKEPTR